MGKQSKAAISLIVLTTTFAFLLPGCGGPHYPSSRAGQILQKADKAMSVVTSYKEQCVVWTHVRSAAVVPRLEDRIDTVGNLEIRNADNSAPIFHSITQSGINEKKYETYGLGGFTYYVANAGNWVKKHTKTVPLPFVTPKALAEMSRNARNIQPALII